MDLVLFVLGLAYRMKAEGLGSKASLWGKGHVTSSLSLNSCDAEHRMRYIIIFKSAGSAVRLPGFKFCLCMTLGR